MLDRILVPLDQSALAESVLPHVVTFNRSFGSRATLLHVLEASPSAEEPLAWHLRKVQAQAYLEQAQARLASHDVTVETALLDGEAAQRIVDYSHSHKLDLVMLSSHGRSGMSGWNMGSITHKVIVRVGCSVLFVPAYHELERPDEVHYRRILLPLDGSSRAECILPYAVHLAQSNEAQLLLLAHMVSKPEMPDQLPLGYDARKLWDEIVERNLVAIQTYLKALRKRLPVPSEIHVEVAKHVAAELQEIAEKNEVDLVLLSAHGHSAQRESVYGRVTRSFVARGATPLLIIQDFLSEELEATAAEAIGQQESNANQPQVRGSGHKFLELKSHGLHDVLHPGADRFPYDDDGRSAI